jgi:hypothetical protein
MIDGRVRRIVACEGGPLALRAVCLSLTVFGASLMAPGRFEPVAQAQTVPATGIGPAGLVLRMDARVRAEVGAALGAMDNRDLALTYARINATFREFLGHDDLSVARALIDYAVLAEGEMRRRGLPLPPGTESAERMHLAYELVL